MERLTYEHIEEIKNDNGKIIRTVNHGAWLKEMDWYAVCENACLLYDEDAECEPDCVECPLRKAFTKLAAYEIAEEKLELAISTTNNGKRIYVISNHYAPDRIIEAEITDYTCRLKETTFTFTWTGLEIYQAFKGYFTADEIGITIFLSYAEAEAALEGGDNE